MVIANDLIFQAKIRELAKHKFQTDKHKGFLKFFYDYDKLDAKYFGVAACISNAKKLNINVPSKKHYIIESTLV